MKTDSALLVIYITLHLTTQYDAKLYVQEIGEILSPLADGFDKLSFLSDIIYLYITGNRRLHNE